MRLMGDLVAIHTDMADAGSRDQVEQAVDHAEAGAEDGDDRELAACDLLAGGLADRRRDGNVLQRKIARGLIALENRQLADKVAELLGSGLLVAQNGKLVLDERVVDHGNAVGIKRYGHLLSPESMGT